MRLRPWYRNLFGTRFGGSLHARCDPWFCGLLVRHLGSADLVRNEAASIELLRPGRGRVSAALRVSPERVEEIRAAADRDGRTEPVLPAEVTAEDSEVVARVAKILRVRRKDAPKPPGRDVPEPDSP